MTFIGAVIKLGKSYPFIFSSALIKTQVILEQKESVLADDHDADGQIELLERTILSNK